MKKRKRQTENIGGTSSPAVPDAPVLTPADLHRFTIAEQSWKHMSNLDDRIAYCRSVLFKHIPVQMPPLVDDVLCVVFRKREAWVPWRPFDPLEKEEYHMDETNKGCSRIEVKSPSFTGFTNNRSLVTCPTKWSCRIVNSDTVLERGSSNYVAVGIYNHTDHILGDLLHDCRVYNGIYVDSHEHFPRIRFFEQSSIKLESPRNLDVVTVEVIRNRSVVRLTTNILSMDFPLKNMADWRPYICLRGNITVDVQEEN